MKLKKITEEYYLSHDFKNLRDETKAHYKYCLGNVMTTSIDDIILGEVDVSQVSTKQAKLAYDLWCDRGISFANHIMATARMVFNYACLLYTSPSPRDKRQSRMPSSA